MMNKNRRYGLGAAAVLGVLAGVGTASWLGRSPSQSASQSDQHSASLWQQSWPTPQGGTLAMASLQGRPVLLNFWATWCPPCVEELPLLDDFYQKNAANGWQVVGIAVDKAEAVQAFLSRQPVRFPVVLAQADGLRWSQSLGNAAGGLPFSVVFGSDGRVLAKQVGRVSPDGLQGWLGLK